MISLGAILCLAGLIGAAFSYWGPPDDSSSAALLMVQRTTSVIFGIGAAIVGAILTTAGELLKQAKAIRRVIEERSKPAEDRPILAQPSSIGELPKPTRRATVL